MAEIAEISASAGLPESMDYDFLREKGIEHLQKLAGKIWTDYNTSDPGVTILEVMCYALTDIGYRTSFDVKDLITQDPSDSNAQAIENFFTARNIMTNAPVTIQDYRKLLMDLRVDATDEDNNAIVLTVRNALIEKAKKSEISFYSNNNQSILTYEPVNIGDQPIAVGTLYDLIIEIDNSGEKDFNNNVFIDKKVYTSTELAGIKTTEPPAPGLQLFTELEITVVVQMPKWEKLGVDWTSTSDIKKHIGEIKFDFSREYTDEITQVDFATSFTTDQQSVVVSPTITLAPSPPSTSGVADFTANIETHVNAMIDQMVDTHQKRVQAVLLLMDKVKDELHKNRNLCEDFLNFKTVVIEEIKVCTDIEILPEADQNEVQAQIFYQIDKFLSPILRFYSLEEMLDKGKSIEEIFDGPKLNSGFIDDTELARFKSLKDVHVSDLINIIMDIEGVVAVKEIQIANLPQLGHEGSFESKNVLWCLELSMAENSVPKFNPERSMVSFFKGFIPVSVNAEIVNARILELKAQDQTTNDGPLDLTVPAGNYREPEDYVSIQEEFPNVYGIGKFGLPGDAPIDKVAKAKQLKGFLLLFDQILSSYLIQLSHVSDLFSMNPSKNENGEFVIDKTYYTKSLRDIDPLDELGISDLFVNDNPTHIANLTEMFEKDEQFNTRKSQILDHLLARFSEDFTEYVLHTLIKPEGTTQEMLIEDKLNFLNALPDLQYERLLGMNYKDACHPYSLDNTTGLERRTSLKVGIETQDVGSLNFGTNFTIVETPVSSGIYKYQLIDVADLLFESIADYTSIDEAKIGLEEAIIVADCKANFIDVDITSNEEYHLYCGDTPLGKVTFKTGETPAFRMTKAYDFMKAESANNPESNRYNKSTSFLNYFTFLNLKNPTGQTPTFTDEASFKVAYDALAVKAKMNFEVDYEVYSDSALAVTDKIVTGIIGGVIIQDANMTSDEAYLLVLTQREEIAFTISHKGADKDNYSAVPTLTEYPINFDDKLKRYTALSYGIHAPSVLAENINTVIIEEHNAYNTTALLLDGQSSSATYVASSLAIVASEIDHIQLQYAGTDTNIPTAKKLSLSYSIAGFQTVVDANNFVVALELDNYLQKGDKFTFEGAAYTIKTILFDGANTTITVEEAIPNLNKTAIATYTKEFEIESVDTLLEIITLSTDQDTKTICDISNLFTQRFTNREGMHIVDHLLLRPKFREEEAAECNLDSSILSWELENLGKVCYISKYTVTKNASPDENKITLTGVTGLVSSLYFGNKCTLGHTYPAKTVTELKTLYSAVETGGDTIITFNEDITLLAADIDFVQIEREAAIESVAVNGTSIVIDEDLYIDTIVSVLVKNSTNGINDRMLQIATVDSASITDRTKITFDKYFIRVIDDFLNINTKADCGECTYVDPYSCVISVILPYWQGRFKDMNYRRLFERTIQYETPAHIIPNICWVGYKDMRDFEAAYKSWLVQNSKETPDQNKLTITLNALIEVLKRIRSKYPTGTLHDCEQDASGTNPILLGNSILGNA
ncbi:MAG: hypothetical protein JKY54_14840 [Flavobacteriales bacterium]|nr:hypothetical protein [Flavobacteriales bacterium]